MAVLNAADLIIGAQLESFATKVRQFRHIYAGVGVALSKEKALGLVC